ncbi:MAG: TMEM175 family protein [Bacteroidia bacterium]
MNKNRLEAFSDGVIAIIITIMVLELKIPHGVQFSDFCEQLPHFAGYVLSFIYVGIYWNNHHHMIHTVKKVSGGILWANLHLLFWLSLFPYFTGWVSEHYREPVPVAAYGAVMLCAAIAYFILQNVILKVHGPDSVLSKAVGKDYKGKISPLLYALAIVLAFYNTFFSVFLFSLVAVIWLIPDKRIERTIREVEEG